jgi:hypothetical protein
VNRNLNKAKLNTSANDTSDVIIAVYLTAAAPSSRKPPNDAIDWLSLTFE